MITDVAQAFMARYNESPVGDQLRAVLLSLWFTQAAWTDDGEVYPYAVFTFDGSNVDEIAGDRRSAIETASITVSIYSENDDGGEEIFDIVQKFIELYDWQTLTYPAGSEYSHFKCQRMSLINRGKVDNVWTIDLIYEVGFNH